MIEQGALRECLSGAAIVFAGIAVFYVAVWFAAKLLEVRKR